MRMKSLLIRITVLLLIVLAVPLRAQEATFDPSAYEENLRLLTNELFNSADLGGPTTTMLINIAESGDALYIAPLLDLAFFFRTPNLRPLYEVIMAGIAEMSNQDFGADWQTYFEWASENDIPLPPRYDRFKGELYSTLIDPNFTRFFSDVQATAEINLLEAIWGGVRVDGIPSLVNARQITPEEATLEGLSYSAFCRDGDCSYPAEDEYVFGVSINGDNRAYPLRLLNWHEMFNDVIGGQPLYDAPGGEIVCQFRAPTPFRAVAYEDEAWVKIFGQSAGCPAEGWLDNPTELDWQEADTWRALPDAERTLSEEEGVIGSIPGKPVMLAYCTLCGSGILYNPTLSNVEIDGETVANLPLEFGSTGMLMRSNKLMYDRTTHTVWNAITGQPAFGQLVGQNIELERLPVVVTDWKTWLDEHPDTSVLSLNTGFQRDYSNGGAYAEYFNDPNFIMFPVWQQNTAAQEGVHFRIVAKNQAAVHKS